MKISIEDVKKLSPCYTDDQLREVFAGREYLTPADIPSLTIPKKDILWVLSHYLPDPRAFARRVALDVVHLWECPPIVREGLTTGDEGLRDAARDAAQVIAWATPRSSARAAAWATTWATTGSAAWNAAWAAAWNAAWAAAWNAAGDATWNAVQAAALDKYIRWAIKEIEK